MYSMSSPSSSSSSSSSSPRKYSFEDDRDRVLDLESGMGPASFAAPSSSSASWDTPFTNSGDDAWGSTFGGMSRSSSGGSRRQFSSRQVFHTLLGLLLVSMGLLVMELRQPGFISHLSSRMTSSWAERRTPSTSSSSISSSVVSEEAAHVHSSPPALLDTAGFRVDISPTSEPTEARGMEYVGNLGSPTSEPTEYRGEEGVFTPTSEPTEYARDVEDPRNLPPLDLEGGSATTPTSEPTVFTAGEGVGRVTPTSEPTMFDPSLDEGSKGNSGPTSEPTIFSAGVDSPPPPAAEPVVPTSEPTVFSGDVPEVSGGGESSPTSEPTVFSGDIPEVSSPTSEPTIFIAGDNEGEGGDGERPGVPGNSAFPTPGPTISADLMSESPTSDPTQYPTPTPTEGSLYDFVMDAIF